MITQQQADAFARDIAHTFDVTIVHAADIAHVAGWIPAVGTLIGDAIAKRFATVSVTLPRPGGGALVILSPVALATPAALVETLAHETEHARQIRDVGGVQSSHRRFQFPFADEGGDAAFASECPIERGP